QFLPRLPGHILTRDEVEGLFRDHNGAGDGADDRHVFCALYRVGLLGYVQHDRVRGQWTQRFLRPGEATLEPDGILPRSPHYLWNPVLSDVIGRVNPAYLERIDRANIVGYGRPWHETDNAVAVATSVSTCCVLKADVYGFANLMLAGADGPVRKALEEAVAAWAPSAAIAETGGGDSLLIAHDDPASLAAAARHILDEVFQAPGQP